MRAGFYWLMLGGIIGVTLMFGAVADERPDTIQPPARVPLVVTIDAAKPPPAVHENRPAAKTAPAEIPPEAAETPPDLAPAASTPQPPKTTEPPRQSVETGRDVDLRSGGGGNHDRIGRVSAGTPVTLLGRQEEWYLISLPSGATGWLPERALRFPPAFDPAAIPSLISRPPLPEQLLQVPAVTGRPVDILAGPAFDQPAVVRGVPPGSPLLPTGRDEWGMWLSVADDFGELGWVPASSLQFAPNFHIFDLPQTVASPEPFLPVVNPYDWSQHIFEWGGQTHDMRHSNQMAGLGMTWVKVQSKWHADSRPRDVEGLIRQAHERGFKLLLAMPGQPYPDEIDFDAYVEFLAGVAALDPPPDAIEIWNEMNIDFEWPAGEIDPALYVEKMLKPAYEAIKAANPSILVISGAPAPTGFDNGHNAWADDRYVAGMVAAGAAAYLDCVGVHYNAGATSPYATSGHPAGDFYGWYFGPALNMVFQAFHGGKPLCITEIGYLTDDDLTGLTLPDRFWWAAGTTVDNHARWLAEARQAAAESGRVRLFIIFSVDIYHWDGVDPQTGYAIFRPRGNCPACEALAPPTAADREQAP